MTRSMIAALMALSLTGAGVLAQEGPRTSLGTLTCSTAPSNQQTNAEMAPMNCAFKATGSAHEERYSGTIAELGGGKKIDGKLVLVWTVSGPANAKLSPGLLAQRYVSGAIGAGSADSAPRVLVGQNKPELVLQEVTDGASGPGVQVTMVDLKLSLTPA